MAKKMVSINLEEEVIQEIDTVSSSVGMSRSSFVNLVMRAVCMGETSEVGSLLIQAAVSAKKSSESEAERALATE